MALTEKERNSVIRSMERLQRQKTMQQVIKEMSRLQKFVDKSAWDAFFASLWWHGGGFFLIGEYFIGITAFLVGYGITVYGVWLITQSILSYFFDFQRCWMQAGIVMIGAFAFDLVIAIWSAIATIGVRQRSRFAIEILKEQCNKTVLDGE
jgi:preprotein translocase subunit Sss1